MGSSAKLTCATSCSPTRCSSSAPQIRISSKARWWKGPRGTSLRPLRHPQTHCCSRPLPPVHEAPSMPKYFQFEKSGVITTITFNRPERRNCLDHEVILELERLIHEVRDDRETRALILTGTGNAFSAGADLSAIKGSDDPRQRAQTARERVGRLPRFIGRVFEAIAHLECITISAVNGYAVGGGWSLALAFDFCVAVENAEFWVPE